MRIISRAFIIWCFVMLIAAIPAFNYDEKLGFVVLGLSGVFFLLFLISRAIGL